MEDLGKRLPRIVEKVLKDEDEATRHLACKLLEEVRSRPNLTKPQMFNFMDDEIDKCIHSNLISESDFVN